MDFFKWRKLNVKKKSCVKMKKFTNDYSKMGCRLVVKKN